MAFVNKVNGIPIDEFLAVNPNWIKVPALDKYGNPYLFEDGTPQYTIIPKSEEEIPTVDPFSGQQVSAQDQAAFTQLQDIFPQQELPTVKPEAPFQPYQSEPSNVGIFAGPSYDKYSAARTDAYANSPSKFDYDIAANQAAGQFIQDRAREIYGDNIFGKGIGTLGAIAGVPLAMFSSPGHEAAQVIMEGRMKPGSGIEGFYKAFMNELPFSTALNRGAGVLKSIPGVGEPIYQGAYKLGEGLANLTSRDPVLSSLTKNFNNLTLQEMNQIRNTPTEKRTLKYGHGGSRTGRKSKENHLSATLTKDSYSFALLCFALLSLCLALLSFAILSSALLSFD